MSNKNIPNHLKKYIVSQNYDDYSIVDHYVWSFIMGISVPFFKKHAHSSYLIGLQETGITIDKFIFKNNIFLISYINSFYQKYFYYFQ